VSTGLRRFKLVSSGGNYKSKVPLYLKKRHIKAYGGVNVYFQVFLTYAQGKCSGLDPGHLTFDENFPSTLQIVCIPYPHSLAFTARSTATTLTELPRPFV
jgi:hypothetical protein